MDIPGQILVRGSLIPSLNIGKCDKIVQGLKSMGIPDLNPLQNRAISAILSDLDTFVVGQPTSGKSIAYLVPVLTHVVQEINSTREKVRSGSPSVLITCPSTSAAISLKSLISQLLRHENSQANPVVFIMDNLKDKTVRESLSQKIDILIWTASVLVEVTKEFSSLLRTKFKELGYERLKYVIFDELGHANLNFVEEAVHLLKCFGVLQTSKAAVTLQAPKDIQLVFCETCWHSDIENVQRFLTNIASRKNVMIFGSSIQALQYARISWKIHHVEEDAKLAVLTSICKDFLKKDKTIVIACSTLLKAQNISRYLADKGGILNKLISPDANSTTATSRGIFSFKTSIMERVQIIPDAAVHTSKINDVSCLVHFDIDVPADKIFTYPFYPIRFSCMWQRLDKKMAKNSNATTHILLNGEEPNLPALYEFIQTLDEVSLPKELQNKIEEMLKEQRELMPLCMDTKCFGICMKTVSGCSYRHNILQQEFDRVPDFPKEGEVEFQVIESVNPSLYNVKMLRYFRFQDSQRICIKSYQDELLDRMTQMFRFYKWEWNRKTPNVIMPGEIYCAALRRSSSNPLKRNYYRVRILGRRSPCLKIEEVEGLCIDAGEIVVVHLSNLYVLTPTFKSWPPHCAQVVLCNLVPADAATEYCAKALEAAKKLTEGKTWQGKIILALGNAVWINPMVQYEQDPVTGHTIKGLNARTELVRRENAGFIGHHKHIDLLLNKQTDSGSANSQTEISCRIKAQTVISNGDEFTEPSYLISWKKFNLTLTKPEVILSPIKLVIHNWTSPWEIYGAPVFSTSLKESSPVYQLELEMTSLIENVMRSEWKDVDTSYMNPGKVVAVYSSINNRWQRGMVISKIGGDGGQTAEKLNIFLVDYGTTLFEVETPKIAPVLTRFVEMLPFQAVCLKLAHAQPMQNEAWNEKDIDEFGKVVMLKNNSENNVVTVMATAEIESSGCLCHCYEAVVLQRTEDGLYEDLGVQLIKRNKARMMAEKDGTILMIKNAFGNLASENKAVAHDMKYSLTREIANVSMKYDDNDSEEDEELLQYHKFQYFEDDDSNDWQPWPITQLQRKVKETNGDGLIGYGQRSETPPGCCKINNATFRINVDSCCESSDEDEFFEVSDFDHSPQIIAIAHQLLQKVNNESMMNN